MRTPKPFSILDTQKFFETTHALALRAGEACGEKTKYDTNKNTGQTLTAEQAIYTPNLRRKQERKDILDVLQVEYAMKGIEKTNTQLLQEAAQLHEPIAFFSVQVEKRKDLFVRKTALPLNPQYEPLTERILPYILERQATPPIFPINRQQALRLANIVFEGKVYKIRAYRRVAKDETGKIILQTEGKNKGKPARVTAPNHENKCGVHQDRHARVDELKSLGITGPILKAFIGWTPKADEVLEETYAAETYRSYLPFLLVQHDT